MRKNVCPLRRRRHNDHRAGPGRRLRQSRAYSHAHVFAADAYHCCDIPRHCDADHDRDPNPNRDCNAYRNTDCHLDQDPYLHPNSHPNRDRDPFAKIGLAGTHDPSMADPQ